MTVATLAVLISAAIAAQSAGAVATAAARAAPAVPRGSPAARAVANGDFEAARHLPAQTLEEALYLEATVALAEHRLDDAEALLRWMLPGPRAAEVAWRAAHARGDPPGIAASARALCAAGDTTGRSCADAELYGRGHARPRIVVTARTEVALSPRAPVPALPVAVAGAGEPRRVGAVVDTGASQTVVSAASAAALGLVTTSVSFPVAVAAGGARASARLAVLERLEVGGVVVERLPVLVVDMPGLERRGIDLVLSPQQAFDGLRVIIDDERRLLCLEPARDAAPGPGQVPYFQVGFDLAVRAAVGDGPSALFGVDTGLDGALTLSSAYPWSPPSVAAPDAQRQAVSGTLEVHGAGARAVARLLAAAPVHLGAALLRADAPLLVDDMPGPRPLALSGFLGNGLWRRGRLVLDTRARRLSIEPHAAGDAAPRPAGP